MPDYINYAVTSTMRSRLKPCYSCPASCLKKCAGKCTLRSLLRGHSLAIDDEEMRADVITGAKDYGLIWLLRISIRDRQSTGNCSASSRRIVSSASQPA